MKNKSKIQWMQLIFMFMGFHKDVIRDIKLFYMRDHLDLVKIISRAADICLFPKDLPHPLNFWKWLLYINIS